MAAVYVSVARVHVCVTLRHAVPRCAVQAAPPVAGERRAASAASDSIASARQGPCLASRALSQPYFPALAVVLVSGQERARAARRRGIVPGAGDRRHWRVSAFK